MLPFAVALSPVLCAFGAVQILGLAAAGLARLTEGTPRERQGQWLCLAALATIGGLCGVAIPFGPDTTAACAVTLAVMTMIAVIDISPHG